MRFRQLLSCASILACLTAWSWYSTSFQHSTTGAIITWSISLATILAINLLFTASKYHLHPSLPLSQNLDPWPPPGPNPIRRTLIGISLAANLYCRAHLGDPRHQYSSPNVHLTISTLAGQYHPLNTALYLVWILVGIGYGATRARIPRPSKPPTSSTLLLAPFFALLLPNSRPIGLTFWICFILVCILLDQYARRTSDLLANAEQFIRLISRPSVANLALIAAWTYAGWHLFVH